ncbi:hypothetical protein [Allorhizobium taibaishanense]|nr:hypothetical protein [Allorhizobium taibaishanense]MBB4007141.1 hypothetical protein [Allorhizobium taibaishanense]
MSIALFAQTAVAQEQQSQSRPLDIGHGITATLSDDWQEESREEDNGNQYIALECISPDCERSLETCHIVAFGKPIEGPDDAARLASLYDSPTSQYFRMRAALISTSQDAQLLQTLKLQRIGPRDWWIIETDAHHNMKSGLFADTVIDGWRVRFTCKTCERGSVRYQKAMQILESVRMANPS